MTDLEGYLGETSSALIQLAALVLAGEEALRTPTVSGYAGVRSELPASCDPCRNIAPAASATSRSTCWPVAG